MSFETAEQLKAAGKGNWTEPRDDKVVAKGKGEMETFWLVAPRRHSCVSATSDESAGEGTTVALLAESNHAADRTSTGDEDSKVFGKNLKAQKPLPAKLQRLVRWNGDVLLRLLKQIVARRNATTQQSLPGLTQLLHGTSTVSDDGARCGTVIDEVKEVIALPRFDAKAVKNQQDARTVTLDKEVTEQLHNYVTVIASLYRPGVPFHNVSRVLSLAIESCSLTSSTDPVVCPMIL
jgi:hypothetical protein